MIFRSVSRPHQRVYSCPIRSGIWSAVILEKSWKIKFLDPPKHHENIIKIYDLYLENKTEDSRRLFTQILPILSFTHQHIDISIKFSKMLRVKEGIFNTNYCRKPIKDFDQFQIEEANIHIEKVLELQNSLNNN